MFSELALTSLLAATALAVPHQQHAHQHQHHHIARNEASNFTITVNNNCTDAISVATYGMNSAFVITQESATHVIEPACTANVTTNYYGIGMRLSAKADRPVAEQYLPQGMFEYGYSNMNGLAGTAYDLSLMSFAGPGVRVVPAHAECEAKCCTPTNCPLNQGWTDPAQNFQADSVCYQGVVDFEVTFCPIE